MSTDPNASLLRATRCGMDPDGLLVFCCGLLKTPILLKRGFGIDAGWNTRACCEAATSCLVSRTSQASTLSLIVFHLHFSWDDSIVVGCIPGSTGAVERFLETARAVLAEGLKVIPYGVHPGSLPDSPLDISAAAEMHHAYDRCLHPRLGTAHVCAYHLSSCRYH